MGHKGNRKHHDRNPSSHKEPPAPRNPPLQVDPAEPKNPKPTDQKQAQCNHQEKPAKWWRSPDWLMVLFTGILAAFAIFSFIALWIQLTDARDAFAKDQRPYVWETAIKPHDESGSRKLFAEVYLANFGKSPAIRQKGMGNILFGRDAMEQADKWFADVGALPFWQEESGRTILAPGIPPEPEKSHGLLYLATTRELLPEEWSYVMTHNYAVAIVTRVEYFDTAGRRYWSDMCVSKVVDSREAPPCSRHNEIH